MRTLMTWVKIPSRVALETDKILHSEVSIDSKIDRGNEDHLAN